MIDAFFCEDDEGNAVCLSRFFTIFAVSKTNVKPKNTSDMSEIDNAGSKGYCLLFFFVFFFLFVILMIYLYQRNFNFLN